MIQERNWKRRRRRRKKKKRRGGGGKKEVVGGVIRSTKAVKEERPLSPCDSYNGGVKERLSAAYLAVLRCADSCWPDLDNLTFVNKIKLCPPGTSVKGHLCGVVGLWGHLYGVVGSSVCCRSCVGVVGHWYGVVSY